METKNLLSSSQRRQSDALLQQRPIQSCAIEGPATKVRTKVPHAVAKSAEGIHLEGFNTLPLALHNTLAAIGARMTAQRDLVPARNALCGPGRLGARDRPIAGSDPPVHSRLHPPPPPISIMMFIYTE